MQASKNNKCLICCADGFEESETVCTIDCLRRSGFDVTIACFNTENKTSCTVLGANNIEITCDCSFKDVSNQKFDCIILPGGKGAEVLANNKELIDMLKIQKRDGRWIAAICSAPALILEPNGLLEGEEATCYPELWNKLKNKNRVKERVVVSNKIITSQGPGTAIEFGLTIVDKLLNDHEKAGQLAEKLALCNKDNCNIQCVY